MIRKSRYALSRYFAQGAGHAIRFKDSEAILFTWNGKFDGVARYVPHVRRYSRNRKEYASLAALLRSVEAEHMETKEDVSA